MPRVFKRFAQAEDAITRAHGGLGLSLYRHAKINVDFRIVRATNGNLRAEVNASVFRLEPHYRIAVVVRRVPALRERVADIPTIY